jgi:hypothetical protein
VAGFDTHKAEIIVGSVANLIGEFNGNRAFTPCFSFSGVNDATVFLTALGAVAGRHVSDFVLETGRVAARSSRAGILGASDRLANATVSATQAATQLAQTALAAEAQQVLNLTNQAKAAADAAALASLRATQAADDARDALATLARLRSTNSPRAAAAKTLADAALEQLKIETEAARVAVNSAADALNGANQAATQLASDAVGTAGAVASVAARDTIKLAGETLANAAALAITAASQSVAAAAQGSLALLGFYVGQVLGPVFDLFAGGDMIMTNTAQHKCELNPSPPPAFPPGAGPAPNTCFLSGDAPNRPTGRVVRDNDPSHSAALISREVPTHEYGHYTLCNMLERVSPAQFAVAYNEAAADSLFGQKPEKQHVVFNESFADLITSQVAGGVDYATTLINLIPPADATISAYSPSHFCPLEPKEGCIEQNLSDPGRVGEDDDFGLSVGRMVTLFNDALDGTCRENEGTAPTNGKAWSLSGGRVFFAGFGLAANVNEEMIALRGSDLLLWIRRSLSRGTLLRESNMFAGLNDVMVERGYSWCQRCQIFKLHQSDGMCPEQWVGPRPAGLVCVDQQPAACDSCFPMGACTTNAECGGANACVNGCCVIG